MFKSWKPNDQLMLDRNDSYFRGTPYLDQYVLKVVADVTTLAAQLKSGEINFGTIEPKDLDDTKRRDTLRVYSFADLSYNYIGWNVKSASTPALADKRVRQALAYGLDMNAVVQQVLYGQGSRVFQHHVAASWAAADASALNRYPYDPVQSGQLLRQAGYTLGADGYYQRDGKPLSITIMTNSGNKVRETLLQTAIDQYKFIGVKIAPRLVFPPGSSAGSSASNRTRMASGTRARSRTRPRERPATTSAPSAPLTPTKPSTRRAHRPSAIAARRRGRRATTRSTGCSTKSSPTTSASRRRPCSSRRRSCEASIRAPSRATATSRNGGSLGRTCGLPGAYGRAARPDQPGITGRSGHLNARPYPSVVEVTVRCFGP